MLGFKTEIQIAFRNIFRNVRRSVMTISAITVAATAMLLFGEFVINIIQALETNFVIQTGHISIFKKGYFELGSGNPGAYGIKNYEDILVAIDQDPDLKSMSRVVTPLINLYGIAGNFDQDTSSTFIARGMKPDDFNKMRSWDDNHQYFDELWGASFMPVTDDTHGVVGVGLAKILGICNQLKMSDCPGKINVVKDVKSKEKFASTRDFGSLGQDDLAKDQVKAESKFPRLDLLSATASGAPNVVSFVVEKAVPQGVKEIDDVFIGLNFNLAQQLLYGRDQKQANAIVIQLNHTRDMDKARAHLNEIFKNKKWDLEIRDLNELQPFYRQAVAMFKSIFSFIAVIMTVIVLFTVINTMTMSVMERTGEIGTLRAIGVKRMGITKQFVLEGWILGVIGATFGVVIGTVVAQIVNHAGMVWLPPGQTDPVPLRVQTEGVTELVVLIWMGLVLMATLAAWVPARRASKMKIITALGHI